MHLMHLMHLSSKSSGLVIFFMHYYRHQMELKRWQLQPKSQKSPLKKQWKRNREQRNNSYTKTTENSRYGGRSKKGHVIQRDSYSINPQTSAQSSTRQADWTSQKARISKNEKISNQCQMLQTKKMRTSEIRTNTEIEEEAKVGAVSKKQTAWQSF